jgi:hypothetical protein
MCPLLLQCHVKKKEQRERVESAVSHSVGKASNGENDWLETAVGRSHMCVTKDREK